MRRCNLRFPTDILHQHAEHRLRQAKRVVRTMVVGQYRHLLHRVDMEDPPDVDDIFTSQAQERITGPSLVRESGFYFGKAERNHEMCPRRVIDMSVMVVGLKIQHPVEIHDIEFTIHTEA